MISMHVRDKDVSNLGLFDMMFEAVELVLCGLAGVEEEGGVCLGYDYGES